MVTTRSIILNNRKEFIDAFRKMFITNRNEVFPGQDVNSDFNIGYALNNWTMFFFFDKDMSVYTTVEIAGESNIDSKKNSRDSYINDQMTRLAMNISDIEVGQSVIDKDGSICKVLNKSANSVEVFISKKTKMGIDCNQYFDMRSFNERFKLK